MDKILLSYDLLRSYSLLTKRVKEAKENHQEQITKEGTVFVESFCF